MNKEKLILQSWLTKIENDRPPLCMRAWFNPALWLMLALVILILLQLGENKEISTIVVVACSSLLGLVVGFISSLQASLKQWPYIKKHINTESIKSRMSELNT